MSVVLEEKQNPAYLLDGYTHPRVQLGYQFLVPASCCQNTLMIITSAGEFLEELAHGNQIRTEAVV